MTAACAHVWLCVRKHAGNVFSSLAASGTVWYENNVQLCMEMLFFATNGLPMPIDRLTQYRSLACPLPITPLQTNQAASKVYTS